MHVSIHYSYVNIRSWAPQNKQLVVLFLKRSGHSQNEMEIWSFCFMKHFSLLIGSHRSGVFVIVESNFGEINI